MHRKATLLPGRKLSQLQCWKLAELHSTIALQTGAKIFESTKCHYGKFVDRLWSLCIKNAAGLPKHSAINSILKRSLTHISFPSTLEPVDLKRDGKRLNGSTLSPWHRGLSLVWDVTIEDTFARSHCVVRAAKAGIVATDAMVAKCQKYNDLLDITAFNKLQSKPVVHIASLLLLFWIALQRNLLICQLTLGSDSVSTSTCPWLWLKEMLPAYRPVCKFSLILAIPVY